MTFYLFFILEQSRGVWHSLLISTFRRSVLLELGRWGQSRDLDAGLLDVHAISVNLQLVNVKLFILVQSCLRLFCMID